jgi:paraquat-inducible protein B
MGCHQADAAEQAGLELNLTSERLGELTPQSVVLYQRYFR